MSLTFNNNLGDFAKINLHSGTSHVIIKSREKARFPVDNL